MIKYRLTHIPNGSWRWQNRYALKSYRLETLKNGKTVWRLFETINKFIKPTWRTTQSWVSHYFSRENDDIYGSLHNRVYCNICDLG